jgi:hypothetical protein
MKKRVQLVQAQHGGLGGGGQLDPWELVPKGAHIDVQAKSSRILNDLNLVPTVHWILVNNDCRSMGCANPLKLALDEVRLPIT